MLRDYWADMTYVLSQAFLSSEVHLKQSPGKTYTVSHLTYFVPVSICLLI